MSMRAGVFAAIAVLTLLGSSVPSAAKIVWKGRDGKSYDTAKPCFENNPQCLPEQGMVTKKGGNEPAAVGMAMTASDAGRMAPPTPGPSEKPVVCLAQGRWMHKPPCDATVGELTVQVLD
jgi:hypothetical protein